MKKITILAAAIAISASANAQISIAPELGINLANMHYKYNDIMLDNGIKLGVKAGVNVNIPVGDNLVIQPGLFYSIKGMKGEDASVSRTTMPSAGTTVVMTRSEENNRTVHYAEIPVNVQYMFNDKNEGRFFIGVGPYLGIAFSGKNKYTYGPTTVATTVSPNPTVTTTIANTEGTHDMTFGSDATQDLGRFDYGAGVNAGYLLRSGIFFRGAYQQSIGNLWPSEVRQDNSIRNSVITISIGYQLGGRDEASPSKRQQEKTDAAM